MRIKSLRQAVAAMSPEDGLEYVLLCWEMLTGQDELEQNIDGVHLTKQQALIFAMLKRRIGYPVPIEEIIAMLDASRNEAVTTSNLVKSQITHIRGKMAGRYQIKCSCGYILKPVASASEAKESKDGGEQ